jgi:hypothetical protein
MSTATLPRFTAHASLGGHISQRTSNAGGALGEGVFPTDFVDQSCLGRCKRNCGLVCAGTTGSAKSACIRECARDNAACIPLCTRPGQPPGGPDGGGGPGGGGGGCAPGATACPDGGCCPPGFPSCVAGTSFCCPPGLQHVFTVFGNTICVP